MDPSQNIRSIYNKHGSEFRRSAVSAKQLPLFELDEQSRPAPRRIPRYVSRRVTSDPDVARSVGRRGELGCDLRSAFVSFWSNLSPERKAEIRARLTSADAA